MIQRERAKRKSVSCPWLAQAGGEAGGCPMCAVGSGQLRPGHMPVGGHGGREAWDGSLDAGTRDPWVPFTALGFNLQAKGVLYVPGVGTDVIQLLSNGDYNLYSAFPTWRTSYKILEDEHSHSFNKGYCLKQPKHKILRYHHLASYFVLGGRLYGTIHVHPVLLQPTSCVGVQGTTQFFTVSFLTRVVENRYS